jgi:single-strand DNA-binding protein
MSSGTMMVTVVGWAATTPREVVGDGVPFTSFRLASTPRYFDGRQGAWADGKTEWVTVKAFREVAFNVAASVHKGDPVLVHGRLQTQEWQSEAGPRTTLVVEAVALGHDLTRGTARFARRVNVSGQLGSDGAPQGESGDLPLGADAVPGGAEIGAASAPPDETDPWATSPEAQTQEAPALTP